MLKKEMWSPPGHWKVFVLLVVVIVASYTLFHTVRTLRDESSEPPKTTRDGSARPTVSPLAAKLARLSVSELIDLDVSAAKDEVVERTFVRLSESTEVACNASDRIGNRGDGGWNVCELEAYLPRRPCLVYSFGIDNDWSFDDGIVEKYKCTVRSFDPSMSIEDQWRNDHNVFLRQGLGGRDVILGNLWRLHKLKTTLRLFGDENKVVDYLKFDIEGSEWESLNASIRDGSLASVKQLAFEVHTDVSSGGMATATRLRLYLGILSELRNLGFYRWYAHRNTLAPSGISPLTGEQLWCCHELVYLNVNYL